MKKLCILISMLYIFSLTVYGDELGGKAGTIYPIFDTSVQMISEKIEIKIKKDIAYVQSEFVLKNTGKKEKVTAGFPAYGIIGHNKEFDNELHDFTVYMDEEKVPIDIKRGLKEEGNNKKELYNPDWYTFEMTFDKEEEQRMVNTYWMYPSYDGIGGEVIEYILKSGGVWNGSIGYGKVTIEFEDDFDPENFELTGYEKYHENIKIEVIPEDKKVILEFYNLEPDFNVSLYHKDPIRNERKDLLEYPISPSDQELWKIQNLGKKAYEDYTKGNYDDAWVLMDKIEAYKESKDDKVAKYAVRMIHLLDYYRAMILVEKGQYEKAAYYLKANGIFEDKNLYQLAIVYKKNGNIDGYIQLLNKIAKGQRDSQVIKIWAEQELNHLPAEVKDKYGITHEIKKEKKIEKEEEGTKKDFSYRSFILFNTGIFILLWVVYWNIKKK